MKVHCYTSISLNYLAKARVLGLSLKRLHPDWTLTLCVTDREPDNFELDLSAEPFDEVLWTEYSLPWKDNLSWIFQHDVVEVCTAVKGATLQAMTERDVDVVLYLDPDVAVLGNLQPIVEALESNSIVLTPHQLTPEESDSAIIDNEICSLAFGTYNLGFVAIRNDSVGKQFAAWWSERLRKFCIDDRPTGLFVDQKWCDLVPALYDREKILRDPGYNVASWNLSNRKLSIDADGNILVNGSHPLRFFHFTKLGQIGDTMTQRYAKDNVEVYELWTWYKRKVDECTEAVISPTWWHFGTFTNGKPIPKPVRRLYRQRKDLQDRFSDPFDAYGDSFYNWLLAEGHL